MVTTCAAKASSKARVACVSLVPEQISLRINLERVNASPGPIPSGECAGHHHLSHSPKEEEEPEETNKVEDLKPSVDNVWSVFFKDALGIRT